ncbi:hypothetical protein BSL78_02350 [Apostichopus japonicus]|uniref:Uncharacterized protein n=1 Tax=Stichopus japonicus TaxID=307972 RepID=A0A2G8LKE0_STIJA|nr:hypothetical protein BSL78_02350 [Apostichopus japonicus]
MYVGHSHPDVTKAVSSQLGLLNTNTRFLHDGMLHMAKRLTDSLPGKLSVCFFCNSGSEANDLALRLARKYTGNKDVLILDDAYHGHTDLLIDISPHKYKKPCMEGKKDWVHVTDTPDIYRGEYAGDQNAGEKYALMLKNTIDKATQDGRKISAFILEAMQSCGGQQVYPAGYMKHCFNKQSLFAADQLVGVWGVGGGSAVSQWVSMTFNLDQSGSVRAVCIDPQMHRMSEMQGPYVLWMKSKQALDVWDQRCGHSSYKAMILNQILYHLVNQWVRIPSCRSGHNSEIATKFGEGGHEYFNTYGGNPVAAAAALAVWDILEKENLREHATVVWRISLERDEKTTVKTRNTGPRQVPLGGALIDA